AEAHTAGTRILEINRRAITHISPTRMTVSFPSLAIPSELNVYSCPAVGNLPHSNRLSQFGEDFDSMAESKGAKSASEMSNGKDQSEIGLEALAGLLDEFRRGNIANGACERQALERQSGELSKRWDQRFPGFPESRAGYASSWGVLRRGVRDKYLKKIIVKLLETEALHPGDRAIVNPACVVGRHARCLASRLVDYRVVATDIFPASNWLYAHLPIIRTPGNHEFEQDDIFEPKVEATPTAVVFFGACGSVSDGAIDYAIQANCLHLICRTCCHDNIGGNTEITRRFTALNWSFRLKNSIYSIVRDKMKGHYFSEKYSQNHYPTSRAAGGLSNSNEFLEVSRNSVDSDICRAIIDLDRYLRLPENRYNAWYKGELFVAKRTT
ncbi:MAG: hypothetical protein PVJ86_12600, partial [Phycisphaerales bacterium]